MWDNRLIIHRQIMIAHLITAFSSERDISYSFQGESHDFWEIVYIQGGIAGIMADGNVFECPPETIIFHKPNEFHRIWNAGKTPLQFTVISFHTGSQFVFDNFSGCITSLSAQARNLMQALLSDIEKNGPSNHFLPVKFRNDPTGIGVSQFCNKLELLLYECCTLSKKIPRKTSHSAKLFSAAVELMNENIGTPLKAQALADSLNVSLGHLKRVFKEYSLMGIHEYFLTIKLEKAKSRLLEGESVSKIADELGFYNTNYFSTVFKRITGVTPTQWRQTAG